MDWKIKFAENYFEKDQINIRELIAIRGKTKIPYELRTLYIGGTSILSDIRGNEHQQY